MKTDAEIARAVRLKPVTEIAGGLNIPQDLLMPYGHYIAKVSSGLLKDLAERPDGKLILITSMSPTPAGEGKTTITIGLAQSLKLLGKNVMSCIRQPSLGPYFGTKGGATGGGFSQVLPPEDITIQFTGDDYAIVTAHNLISSIIDNHIYHGNRLGIDPGRILWSRVSTVNDRALRKITVSVGKEGERAEEFHISAASEVMSILCLSKDLSDLRERAGRIIAAFGKNGSQITVRDLKVQGAVAALLRNAIHPNLVQSVEGVPVFVHGGPFGNISLGCNSLISTKLALKLSDFVLAEAGFATELGAEKFLDIKCRIGGLTPSAAVIVATIKALRFHGGSRDFHRRDAASMIKGLDNLDKHIENIKKFNLPFIVAVNRFISDTDEEIDTVTKALEDKGVTAVVADVRERGGEGGVEAAQAILKATEEKNNFRYLYSEGDTISGKISTIATEMYGADGVDFTPEAQADIKELKRLGCDTLPVCIAKTPKSLSDKGELIGRPRGFRITVNRVNPAAGAGFLVALCGSVLLMPGLPECPLAESIDIDTEGRITGV